jgi:AcrR family transcriptional regulator
VARGLSRELVLDTALRFIDEHGVAALSMRKLGAELGVEAMTLYYYLPNKAALLDGVVERIFGMVAAELPSPDVRWEEYLRGLAEGLRRVLLRHPQVLSMAATRPVITPEGLVTLETALEVLCGAGMPVRRALHVFNAVSTFVLGHVLNEAGQQPVGDFPDLQAFPLILRAVEEGAGQDDDEERFDLAITALIRGFGGAEGFGGTVG